MNNLISICIPTFNRTRLLQESIESCIAQDYSHSKIEVIVSDDSSDSATERLVKSFQRQSSIDIQYVQNIKNCGQAGNVNYLFDIAQGDRLILLHDDDLLLPNAISNLVHCWEVETDLTAAFGKQFLISEESEILLDESDCLNNYYYRSLDRQGVQLSSLESALLQQFPNDGYMILSAAAKEIKYRDQRRWCDYDFSIRLALKHAKFFFLDEYTSKYRLTSASVSKSSSKTESLGYLYWYIESLKVPENVDWAKEASLKRIAPLVLLNHVFRSERKEALKIFFSRYYPLKKRIALKGLYHFLGIFFPLLFDLRFRSKRKDFFYGN